MYFYSTEGIQHNKKTLSSGKSMRSIFQDFLLLSDCTEQQQIPRPMDNNKRKMYYSLGKKKRHTDKESNYG